MMSDEISIEDAVKDKLTKTGKLSSSDVASFASEAGQSDATAKADNTLEEDTEADLKRSTDKVLDAARKQTFGRADGKAIITPEDKSTFIAALVNNGRYVRKYTALGGAISLTLRSRSVEETNAVVAAFAKEAQAGNLSVSAIQTNALRSMLMVFQVSELNGTAYASPAQPIVKTVSDDGVTEPAWYARVEEWNAVSDALHGVIWQCLTDFEDRYWTMVENAARSDFWQPAESI